MNLWARATPHAAMGVLCAASACREGALTNPVVPAQCESTCDVKEAVERCDEPRAPCSAECNAKCKHGSNILPLHNVICMMGCATFCNHIPPPMWGGKVVPPPPAEGTKVVSDAELAQQARLAEVEAAADADAVARFAQMGKEAFGDAEAAL